MPAASQAESASSILVTRYATSLRVIEARRHCRPKAAAEGSSLLANEDQAFNPDSTRGSYRCRR
jgi:hypothetical protein